MTYSCRFTRLFSTPLTLVQYRVRKGGFYFGDRNGVSDININISTYIFERPGWLWWKEELVGYGITITLLRLKRACKVTNAWTFFTAIFPPVSSHMLQVFHIDKITIYDMKLKDKENFLSQVKIARQMLSLLIENWNCRFIWKDYKWHSEFKYKYLTFYRVN